MYLKFGALVQHFSTPVVLFRRCYLYIPLSNNRFTTCSHTCGYGSKWIQTISRYIQILYPRNWMVDPKHKNASVLVAWGLDFDIWPPYRFHIFSFARRSEQPDPTSTALTAFPGTCNMLGCWVCQIWSIYVMFCICLFSVHLGFRNTQTMLGSATAKQHAQHARLDWLDMMIWFAIKRHNKTRAHDNAKEDGKMIIQEVPGRWQGCSCAPKGYLAALCIHHGSINRHTCLEELGMRTSFTRSIWRNCATCWPVEGPLWSSGYNNIYSIYIIIIFAIFFHTCFVPCVDAKHTAGCQWWICLCPPKR